MTTQEMVIRLAAVVVAGVLVWKRDGDIIVTPAFALAILILAVAGHC